MALGADLYLGNGIIAKGQPTTILGPGGVGKSRLVLQMAVAMLTGREFLGMPVTSSKLGWVFIQAENNNRRLKADIEKLKAWIGAKGWKEVDQNLLIHTLETDHDHFLGLSDPASKERVAQLIKSAEADVVVFDPLFAFGSGNLNTDAAMLETCKAITELARLGKPECSIIILHHTLTGKVGIKKAVGYLAAPGEDRGQQLQVQEPQQLQFQHDRWLCPWLPVLLCAEHFG